MIKVDNVSFSYGKHKILNNISFEIPTGSCACIIGANGCGKSTLLSILTGTRKPLAGTVSFPVEKSVSYVPQDNPLLPDVTAKENLYLWFKGGKADFKAALESDYISMLGIKDFLNKPVKKLSGGMKKRLSIAIAIINNPSILILDEPSAALDLPCKMDIRAFLNDFIKKGGTVIITTHDEEELDLCTLLYVLKDSNLSQIECTLRGSSLTALL